MIFIGVGANIDPEDNIIEGLVRLREHVRIVGLSTFYRSEAIGAPGTPDFINGVCCIETDLAPRELKLDVLRVIEAALGRVRGSDPNAPRPLDLDLLLYHDVVDEVLGIPDDDVLKRPFLYKGIAELNAEVVWPATGQRLADEISDSDPTPVQGDDAYSSKLRIAVGL